jgi:murein DD-endopeptidase MepM/ murein hydrolase activator NlpD
MKQKRNKQNLGIKTSEYLVQPLSRLAKYIFELKKIKQAFGLLMAGGVLVMAIVPTSLSTFQAQAEINQAQIEIDLALIKTESSIRLPLENFRFTQGFSFLHQGIDLAAPQGTPIYPIMEGFVEQVEYSRWGYGDHIYVNHGNGLKTLYAHCAQINVKPNEFVNKSNQLGTVGSTGWSSGPHLHFQVWENEKLVNPKTFLEGYSGQKLISTR